MSWKRAIANKLDNRVGRPLLGRMATARARRLLHGDVEIRHDEVWFHRVGPYFVPDGPRFEYYDATILAWRDEIPTYFRNAAEFWFFDYRPQLNDVIVDVGAGRGEDVLAFSREVGPTGKVLAIEAHPRSYDLLRRFCDLNRLRNVIPVHAAIMDTAGTVTIDDGDMWQANSVHSAGAGIPVGARTLDDVCSEQRIDRIDFLKINVEGAESNVLRAMRNGAEHVRRICVCCHDFRADRGHGEMYRTREFVTKFLTECGFLVSRRSDDPRDFARDHVHGTRE